MTQMQTILERIAISQNEINCTHEQAFHYPEVTLRKYGSPVKASEKEEEDNLDAVQDEAPVQQNDSNSALGIKKMRSD